MSIELDRNNYGFRVLVAVQFSVWSFGLLDNDASTTNTAKTKGGIRVQQLEFKCTQSHEISSGVVVVV